MATATAMTGTTRSTPMNPNMALPISRPTKTARAGNFSRFPKMVRRQVEPLEPLRTPETSHRPHAMIYVMRGQCQSGDRRNRDHGTEHWDQMRKGDQQSGERPQRHTAQREADGIQNGQDQANSNLSTDVGVRISPISRTSDLKGRKCDVESIAQCP